MYNVDQQEKSHVMYTLLMYILAAKCYRGKSVGVVCDELENKHSVCEVALHVRLIRTQNANRQARARKRMPLHESIGEAKISTNQTHFVLVEVFERLDHTPLSSQLANQLGVVVVRLDGICFARCEL